jgi:hypothetical protein
MGLSGTAYSNLVVSHILLPSSTSNWNLPTTRILHADLGGVSEGARYDIHVATQDSKAAPGCWRWDMLIKSDSAPVSTHMWDSRLGLHGQQKNGVDMGKAVAACQFAMNPSFLPFYQDLTHAPKCQELGMIQAAMDEAAIALNVHLSCVILLNHKKGWFPCPGNVRFHMTWL